MDLVLKTSNVLGTQGSGTNNVVWVIFGLIVALAAGFFLFTFLRDKRKKRIIREDKIRKLIKSEIIQQEIILEINNLITLNKQALDEFIPSIGKLKMSEINDISKNKLKELTESEKYFKYIKSQDEFKDFQNHLQNLSQNKANVWEKICSESLDFFKNKFEKIDWNDELKEYNLKSKNQLEKLFFLKNNNDLEKTE
ncbi:MHJ_0274 family protein [[Mycoplasma] mobile]|uniref:Expressed protein n=1 Tax=Mycoplasma mobile (strain ATCC 43663 / 163K / NCTC 11711) TaxID=267748 RepID=Q6KHT4_MYCM1|nr:hypothetical protein [[Mycoplasma] mobile]AAT27844.1 expressed protein [Mycoplasma mobile 163K]